MVENGTHLEHSFRFEPKRPAAFRAPVIFVDKFVEMPHKADEVNPIMDNLFFDCHFWREIRERIKKEGNIKGRGCKNAKVGGRTRVAVQPPPRRTSRTAKLHLHVSWTL